MKIKKNDMHQQVEQVAEEDTGEGTDDDPKQNKNTNLVSV